MARQFTLGKKERLKSRKSIERLFSEGKSFAIAPFRVYYLPGNEADFALQFGTGVSSRHFKKAVHRNRIKRLTREAWRLQRSALQQLLQEQSRALHVFVIYTGRELPAYQAVYEKLGAVIGKLIKIVTPAS